MRYNIPTVTKNLLVINIVAFLANYLTGGRLNDWCGLHFFMASDFHVYQFVTYMFMHGSFMHILMNMFMLWMFGAVIERVWGPRRYLIFYFVCGLGAAFCQEVAQFVDYSMEGLAAYQGVNINGSLIPTDAYLNLWNTVGASGAIYGIELAFAMLFPEQRMFIIPIPFPIKAKWLMVGLIGIELLSALSSSNDGVAHLAHLGGMLFGFLLIKYWQRHPYGGSGYGQQQGFQFFDNLRSRWEQRNGTRTKWHTVETHPNVESDWDYNARKRQEQDEIDRILDKIRKSGYDSLTKAEKLKLFEQSNKR